MYKVSFMNLPNACLSSGAPTGASAGAIRVRPAWACAYGVKVPCGRTAVKVFDVNHQLKARAGPRGAHASLNDPMQPCR